MSTAWSRPLVWAAYGACAWAFIFAAMSFYWAAGGTAAGDTLGPGIERLALARDPGFIAILWITGVLKVVGGLLALALVRPWGRLIPHWLLLSAAGGAGVLMVLYESAELVQHILMRAGVLGIPASLGTEGVRGHLLLWDPWWILGGVLYSAAAWTYWRGRVT